MGDIAVYNFLDQSISADSKVYEILDNEEERVALLRKYPLLQDLYERVGENENIKKYKEK